MGKEKVGEEKVGKRKVEKGKLEKENGKRKNGKRKSGKRKSGKSGNNETFVVHTKECSTGQIIEGKMGERKKRGRGRKIEKNGRKKRMGERKEGKS